MKSEVRKYGNPRILRELNNNDGFVNSQEKLVSEKRETKIIKGKHKYLRKKPVQVFESNLKLLNHICNEFGLSKSGAYKMALRIMAKNFKIEA